MKRFAALGSRRRSHKEKLVRGIRVIRSRRLLLAVFGTGALAAASTAGIASAGTLSAAGSIAPDAVFNVKNFGATGNGSTNDAAAIQKAVDAAGAARGGTGEFPSGTSKTRHTIPPHDNITVTLDNGSTPTRTPTRYDAP